MIRRRYYWFLILLSTLGPLYLCNMQSDDRWQRWSEWFYAKVSTDDHVQGTSPLAVIDVDQKTLDTFGWPIPRKHYRDLLQTLNQSEHPVVLSFLRFQELGKGNKREVQEDKLLADAIKAYGDVIGTGINLDSERTTELNLEDHELTVKKAVASVKKLDDVNLPRLPLAFEESRQFMAAELAFGFGARLGGERVVLCPQTALIAKPDTGSFAIMSSAILAASRMLGVGIRMPSSGAVRDGASAKMLDVSYRTCLKHSKFTTAAYFARRKINVYSLADILEHRVTLKGVKAVILGHKDLRRVQGPGATGNDDDAVTLEHHLITRLFDGIIQNDTVARGLTYAPSFEKNIVIALVFLFFILAVFFGPGWSSVAAVAVSGAFIVKAYYMITASSQYEIYAKIITTALLCGITLALAAQFLLIAGIRWRLNFLKDLNRELSKSNSIEELTSGVIIAGHTAFSHLSCTLQHDYADLYHAATDPKFAAKWLAGGGDPKAVNALLPDSPRMGKLLAPITAKNIFQTGHVTYELDLSAGDYVLGRVHVEANVSYYERSTLPGMFDALSTTLEQHWRRVDLMVRSRAHDYKLLAVHSRTGILAKFLPKSLVHRFDDSQAMEKNLERILTPQVVNAALLQADIRGFSKLAGKYSNMDLVVLIQSYFKNVVDAAQLYAQIKLIGDCIFLFVEDGVVQGRSSVDFVAEIGAFLVAETQRRNAERHDGNDVPLYFGIAIHYGEVVVGNLSSDDCIDYTVIGANVNLTARLEELTKTPAIKKIVGDNGMIWTAQAIANLNQYRDLKFPEINLTELRANVRSFEQIQRIYYMTADTATQLYESTSLAKKIA